MHNKNSDEVISSSLDRKEYRVTEDLFALEQPFSYVMSSLGAEGDP